MLFIREVGNFSLDFNRVRLLEAPVAITGATKSHRPAVSIFIFSNVMYFSVIIMRGNLKKSFNFAWNQNTHTSGPNIALQASMTQPQAWFIWWAGFAGHPKTHLTGCIYFCITEDRMAFKTYQKHRIRICKVLQTPAGSVIWNQSPSLSWYASHTNWFPLCACIRPQDTNN